MRSRFRHGAVVDEFERDDALFVQVDDLDAVAGVGEALAPQLLEQRRAVPGEQAEELGDLAVLGIEQRLALVDAKLRAAAHHGLLGEEEVVVQHRHQARGVAEVEDLAPAAAEQAQMARAEDQRGVDRRALGKLDHLALGKAHIDARINQPVVCRARGQHRRRDGDRLEDLAAVAEHDLRRELVDVRRYVDGELAVLGGFAALGRQVDAPRGAVAVAGGLAVAQAGPAQLDDELETLGGELRMLDRRVRARDAGLSEADPAAHGGACAGDEILVWLAVVQQLRVDPAGLLLRWPGCRNIVRGCARSEARVERRIGAG